MPEEKVSDQHPDWRVFEDEAARGTVFTNFAYQQKGRKKIQAIAETIPEGYELFLMTDHLEDSMEASFRCVAFVNHETKDIVCATAGTRPGADQKGAHDLMDDALLLMRQEPQKMSPAKVLNDMILDSLGDEAKDFKFHYTGHSLGAAMAEMQAVDMDIKLRKSGLKRDGDREQLSAVTFENPGTRPIVKKMYRKAGIPVEAIKDLNFCEFNNRGNIINSLNKQTGSAYEIVPPGQKERKVSPAQMVFEYLAKKASKINRILGKVFSLLAPGGLNAELITDHALTNFDDVFVKKQGGIKEGGEVIPLEKAYSGVTPIEYDKGIAETISDMQKTNGQVGKKEFSMTAVDPETKEVSRVECSAIELESAVKRQKSKTQHTAISQRRSVGVGKFSDRLSEATPQEKKDAAISKKPGVGRFSDRLSKMTKDEKKEAYKKLQTAHQALQGGRGRDR